MVHVGDLLEDLERAFKRGRNSLINAIHKWAETAAREASLTGETYSIYRSATELKAHLATVVIFLEYLVAHRGEVRDSTAANRVYARCLDILTESKKRRFERNPGQEPSADSHAVDRYSGAYVLVRMETQIRKPCQELLLLNSAEKHERVRYATLVGRNLVSRGRWHLLGSTIHINSTGYRPGHEPDFLGISLSRGEPGDVMGGVLTGLTTQDRDPLMMCVLAIRMQDRDVDQNLFYIGNQSDPEIIDEFCKFVPRAMSPEQRKLLGAVHTEMLGGEQLPESPDWFRLAIINATDPFVAGVRGTEDLRRLIVPGLLKFCRKKRTPSGTAFSPFKRSAS